MGERQVKIVSDGTPQGTQVLVDGKPMHGIQRIEVTIDATDYTSAVIELRIPQVELDGVVHDVEIVQPEPFVVSTQMDGTKEKIFTHDHKPVQHRDGKPPWCPKCGLTQDGRAPKSQLDKFRERNADIDAADEDD